MTRAPLLVLGIGNPSRGDDALGPLFIERASEALSDEIAVGQVELLTDFQLQIEHALDLVGREQVIFVDASMGAARPFELSRIAPGGAIPFSTHALSPEAVLETHRRIVGEPPQAWVLAIRGDRFELGDPLSSGAQSNLASALELLVSEVRKQRPKP